ncbi:hypothetical protein MHYP_G00093480 [Metynnis hypsauchen]
MELASVTTPLHKGTGGESQKQADSTASSTDSNYRDFEVNEWSSSWGIEVHNKPWSLFLSSIMTLLAPVLLLLALSGCSSEVVDDFTQMCPQFFANPNGIVSPPTVFKGNNYKQICQIQEKTPEYATLYDTEKKIPVYSAYKFKGVVGCKRLTKWYIEPQLENISKGPKMAPESSMTNIQNQAVNKDYYKSGYDRGHLAPVLHSTSQSCSDVTFTLTNAAPQHCSFNKGQWKKTERKVADVLNKTCLPNSAFIVTGVVPGYNEPPLKNRVIIPSHFWTAYCCLDNNLKVIDSNGFIGQNQNDQVKQMSVSNLEVKLTHLYNQGTFHIFGGKCNESRSTTHSLSSGDDLEWLSLIPCQKRKVPKQCVETYHNTIRRRSKIFKALLET